MDLPRPCIVEVTQIVTPEDVPVIAARVAERLAMPVERVQKLIDGRTGPITRPLRPDKAEAIAQTFEAAGVAVSIRLATAEDEPDAATPPSAPDSAAVAAGPSPAGAVAPDVRPDVPPPDGPSDAPDEVPPDGPPGRPPDEPPEEDDGVPAEAPGRDPEPEPAELPRRDADAVVGEFPTGPAPFDTPPGRTATRSAAGRAAAPARGGAPLRIEPDDDDDEEPGEAGHPARGEVPPRRRPLVVEFGSADDDGGERPLARRQDPSSGVIPVLGPGTHPTFTDEDTWGGDTDPEGAWIIRPSSERRGGDDHADPPRDADVAELDVPEREVPERDVPGRDVPGPHAAADDRVGAGAPFDVDDLQDRFDDLELPPLRLRDDDEPEVELDTDPGGAGEWHEPDAARKTPIGRDAMAPEDAFDEGGAYDEASDPYDEASDDAYETGQDDPTRDRPWARPAPFEPEDGDALDEEGERVPIAWRGLGEDESGPARPPGARIPRRVDAETLRAEEEAQRVVVRRTAMLWALVLAVVAFVLVQFWVAGRAAEGYVDGLHRYRDAQFASARGVWTRLAEAGDPNAQFMLGYMSEAGLGQSWSARAAASWYRMAADAGHAEAQWRLGTLYERGLGVPWSLVDARRWWAAAAAGGHAEAAAALAHSHLVDGPVPDLPTARAAFTVAAALGRRDARVYLDLLSVVSDDANARAVP